jgi:citrate lyase beta subunit
MQTSLSTEAFDRFSQHLSRVMRDFETAYPGESGRRQPVHTVYGGAHLFKSDTTVKLGELAGRAFRSYAPDAESFQRALRLPNNIADTVYGRVREKLENEAVEDFRIDFEDGYGTRADDEEDGHAIQAAREVAKGMAEGTLSPFIGIRIKTFSEELHARSIRTLDLFLTRLLAETNGRLPDNLVITFPKIVSADQVSVFVEILTELEAKLGLESRSLLMEMMVETPQSIIARDGTWALPAFLAAADGRCRGAHFGTYDYTASCSITAAYQNMLHQACDFARNTMQIAFAGTGVWLSDGATNIMPIAPHRGKELTDEQVRENESVVHRAWKLHYDHCQHSLANAFYQGWDLHPGQLPTRYAAVYTFFLEGLSTAGERLRNFVDKAAQATLVGDVFDDAATGQGLLNYFLRAINCGAITEQEAVDRTSITLEELQKASFVKILENRR